MQMLSSTVNQFRCGRIFGLCIFIVMLFKICHPSGLCVDPFHFGSAPANTQITNHNGRSSHILLFSFLVLYLVSPLVLSVIIDSFMLALAEVLH